MKHTERGQHAGQDGTGQVEADTVKQRNRERMVALGSGHRCFILNGQRRRLRGNEGKNQVTGWKKECSRQRAEQVQRP